jgi:hypothetical protein
MKKFAVLLLVSSLFTLELALEGAAQTRPTPPPAAGQAPVAPRETWKNQQGLHSASTIVGTRVKDAEGKDMS